MGVRSRERRKKAKAKPSSALLEPEERGDGSCRVVLVTGHEMIYYKPFLPLLLQFGCVIYKTVHNAARILLDADAATFPVQRGAWRGALWWCFSRGFAAGGEVVPAGERRPNPRIVNKLTLCSTINCIAKHQHTYILYKNLSFCKQCLYIVQTLLTNRLLAV